MLQSLGDRIRSLTACGICASEPSQGSRSVQAPPPAGLVLGQRARVQILGSLATFVNSQLVRPPASSGFLTFRILIPTICFYPCL